MSVGKLSLVLTITILFVMLFISATSVLDSHAITFKPIKPKPIKPKPIKPIGPFSKPHVTEIPLKKVGTVKPLYKPENRVQVVTYVEKSVRELNNHLLNILAPKIIAFFPCLIP